MTNGSAMPARDATFRIFQGSGKGVGRGMQQNEKRVREKKNKLNWYTFSECVVGSLKYDCCQNDSVSQFENMLLRLSPSPVLRSWKRFAVPKYGKNIYFLTVSRHDMHDMINYFI